MYTIFSFIHSSVDRHPAWFHDLAVMSSTATNGDVQDSLQRVTWSLLGKFPGTHLTFSFSLKIEAGFSCMAIPFPVAWTVADQWLLSGCWADLEH